MSNKNGGPAFPRAYGGHPDPAPGDAEMQSQEGMTLRDYFASQALTGLIGTYVVGNGTCMGTEHFANNVSIHAYKMADAMLRARSQP